MPKTQSKARPTKGGAGAPKRARRGERPAAPAPKPTAIVRAERPQPLTIPEAIEKVLLEGNLQPLNAEQRLQYYKKVCESLGLNPLTRPLEYIAFEGKLMLYARKDCTEQLRKIHGVAVTGLTREMENDLCIYTAAAQDKHGRLDHGTGVVNIKGLGGKDLANAIMKAETKAKRRVTLSICGLGMLDESELDGLDEYGMLTPRGRVFYEEGHEPSGQGTRAQREVAERKIAEHKQLLAEGKPQEAAKVKTITQDQISRFWAVVRAEGWKDEEVIKKLREKGYQSTKDIPHSEYDALVESFIKPKVKGTAYGIWGENAQTMTLKGVPKDIEQQVAFRDVCSFLQNKKVWMTTAECVPMVDALFKQLGFQLLYPAAPQSAEAQAGAAPSPPASDKVPAPAESLQSEIGF